MGNSQSNIGGSSHNVSQINASGFMDTTNYGKSKGKRPAARDGHTGIVFGNYFIVFGGDRHHMPFNDTFILDLKQETISKSFLF
jgi:hypothetical protein